MPCRLRQRFAAYWERQLHESPNARYPLLLPTVLRDFTQTETWLALLGSTAGTTGYASANTRTAFEAKIQDIDERMHAPTDDWTEMLSGIIGMIQPLATAWILEGNEAYSAEHIRAVLDQTQMLSSDHAEILESEGWQAGADGNTIDCLHRFIGMLDSPLRLRFASADILNQIGIILLIESSHQTQELPNGSSREQAEDLVQRFTQFASVFGITEAFARGYLNAISERLLADSADSDDA